jgi:predicted esterase
MDSTRLTRPAHLFALSALLLAGGTSARAAITPAAAVSASSIFIPVSAPASPLPSNFSAFPTPQKSAAQKHPAAERPPERPQDTGFLNRRVTVKGVTYKFMVYLPQDYDPHRKWPVILFLHGMGERGSDGETEANTGLPAALRNHPEHWPFIVVMPQLPFNHHYWPDPDMMSMTIAELDQSSREFHGDTDRTYLVGMSLGAFGAWELARYYPGRWAAIITVCGGIRWDWIPGGRHGDAHLADAYVTAIAKTPVWIFHGADDPVVSPTQSEEMYDALKAGGGNVRYWSYERTGHNSWDRVFADPEVPHWLLAHALHEVPATPADFEKRSVPIHPVPIKIDSSIYESYAGEYSAYGTVRFWVTNDAGRLLLHQRATVNILLPESPNSFFFDSGGPVRIIFDKDSSGRVTGLTYRDDRHEEYFARTR